MYCGMIHEKKNLKSLEMQLIWFLKKKLSERRIEPTVIIWNRYKNRNHVSEDLMFYLCPNGALHIREYYKMIGI